MRIYLRAFSTYCGIKITELVTLVLYEFHSFTQYDLTVHIQSFGGSIREMITYVAHISGTEDSVAHSVEQYISIAMSEESQRMF